MSQLSEKISEIEKKRRRKETVQYITLALIVLGAFAFYYIITWDTQIESEQTIVEKQQEINKKKATVGSLEKSKNEEQGNIEEIRATNRKYIKQLEEALREVKAKGGLNKKGEIIIDNILLKIDSVYYFNSDDVTIQFGSNTMKASPYSISEDSLGNFISNTLKSIPNPDGAGVTTNSDLDKVNTLYYGSLVTTSYIDSLSKDLESKGIHIERIEPFKRNENGIRNEKSIKLDYIKYTDSVAKKNDDYHIRMYAYKPNPENKKIIENTLIQNNYNFQLFPDWVKKPSFFSSVPTVLYYDEASKKEAEELAKILSNDLPDGVDFTIRQGNGYGVSEAEKKTLLIIHYLPNQ